MPCDKCVCIILCIGTHTPHRELVTVDGIKPDSYTYRHYSDALNGPNEQLHVLLNKNLFTRRITILVRIYSGDIDKHNPYSPLCFNLFVEFRNSVLCINGALHNFNSFY